MAQININTEEVRKINGNLESTNANLLGTLTSVTTILTELSSNIQSENIHPQIVLSLNTLEDAASIMKTKLPRLTSFIEGQVSRYVQNDQVAETALAKVLNGMTNLSETVTPLIGAVSAAAGPMITQGVQLASGLLSKDPDTIDSAINGLISTGAGLVGPGIDAGTGLANRGIDAGTGLANSTIDYLAGAVNERIGGNSQIASSLVNTGATATKAMVSVGGEAAKSMVGIGAESIKTFINENAGTAWPGIETVVARGTEISGKLINGGFQLVSGLLGRS